MHYHKLWQTEIKSNIFTHGRNNALVLIKWIYVIKRMFAWARRIHVRLNNTQMQTMDSINDNTKETKETLHARQFQTSIIYSVRVCDMRWYLNGTIDNHNFICLNQIENTWNPNAAPEWMEEIWKISANEIQVLGFCHNSKIKRR